MKGRKNEKPKFIAKFTKKKKDAEKKRKNSNWKKKEKWLNNESLIDDYFIPRSKSFHCWTRKKKMEKKKMEKKWKKKILKMLPWFEELKFNIWSYLGRSKLDDWIHNGVRGVVTSSRGWHHWQVRNDVLVNPFTLTWTYTTASHRLRRNQLKFPFLTANAPSKNSN